MRKHGLFIFALVYLFIRFVLTRQLDAIGDYASYIFEVLVLIGALYLLREEATSYLRIPKAVWRWIAASFVGGVFIFYLAPILRAPIPFDLKSGETILFLLVIGPLIEELIFRFFLWKSVEKQWINPVLPWVVTSLLFSYAHLHAIWLVPADVHPFILYQSFYTLFLGAACGYFMRREKSLTAAWLVHFAFNFGFFVSSTL